MSRLEIFFHNQIARDLLLKKNYNNIMEIPQFQRIILSTALDLGGQDEKLLAPHLLALEKISHQKPKRTYSKKSIAEFNLRKDQLLGCYVTLRQTQLFHFLDHLILLVLPQIPDFEKFQSQNLLTHQSFTIGFQQFAFFPEIERDFDLLDFLRGMNITFITSAKTKEELILLLTSVRFPI